MKNLKAKLNAKKRKGFTIVELIVVMAIIAILTLIAVPTFSKFLDQANDTAEGADASTLYKVTMNEVISESVAPTPEDLGSIAFDDISGKDIGVAIKSAANFQGTDIVVKANVAKTTLPTDNTEGTGDGDWHVYIPVTNKNADETGNIYVFSPTGHWYTNGMPGTGN